MFIIFMPKFISDEKLKKILELLEIEYGGLTKSGEPILNYKGNKFTISRKKDKGYKSNVIEKILSKVSIEKAKEENKNPKQIYHELEKKLKEIYSF